MQLEMMLASELGELSRLQQLKVLGVGSMNPRVSMKGLEWMSKVWLNLQRVIGVSALIKTLGFILIVCHKKAQGNASRVMQVITNNVVAPYHDRWSKLSCTETFSAVKAHITHSA